VSAFEQSLQNMTNRLQQLTATTEKKVEEKINFFDVGLASCQIFHSPLSFVWNH
jgi:hypothetical protein